MGTCCSVADMLLNEESLQWVFDYAVVKYAV